MSKKITIDEVKKLAKLSKIDLSDAEAKKFQDEFAKILQYVKKLDQLDTSDLKPTIQVTGLVNAVRDDDVRQSPVSKEDLIALAPKSDDDYVLVNEVL